MDFGKTFNINIVLYSYDNKGHIIKMNKKNGSMFGEKNASQSFDLATFKNHYFLYDTEATEERFISYYVVKIEITKVSIQRDFPLIVEHTKQKNMNVNKCYRMEVDQNIEF